MFYYLLHFPLIHLLAVAVCYARYGQVHWMFESPTIAQFPCHPATRMGILFAGDLPDLGFGRARALSALPLVCSPETAAERCVAQLSLEPGFAAERPAQAALGRGILLNPKKALRSSGAPSVRETSWATEPYPLRESRHSTD